MTEKRQISQGYIIRILQHFATKLWNITNFVMLFQAVMLMMSFKLSIDQNFSYKGKGPYQSDFHQIFTKCSPVHAKYGKVVKLTNNKIM